MVDLYGNFGDYRNMGSLRVIRRAVAAGVFSWMAATSAWAGIVISDDFEGEQINLNNWSLIHMPAKRHWMDANHKRNGKTSLAIRVKGDDLDKRCNCQISEIREANAVRLNFGEEAWYAFSFRVSGRGGDTKEVRWQISAWKQETDGSPFLSQRLDNGVFHITLESRNSRVLIASAQGKPEGFISAIAKGLMSKFGFLMDKEKYDGKDDISLTFGSNPILPNPHKEWVDMMYHIKGGMHGDGFVEVYANGKFIAKAEGTIGVPSTGGNTQYFRIGHNRAAMPGTATLYLDRYRRGNKRSDVEKLD